MSKIFYMYTIMNIKIILIIIILTWVCFSCRESFVNYNHKPLPSNLKYEPYYKNPLTIFDNELPVESIANIIKDVNGKKVLLKKLNVLPNTLLEALNKIGDKEIHNTLSRHPFIELVTQDNIDLIQTSVGHFSQKTFDEIHNLFLTELI